MEDRLLKILKHYDLSPSVFADKLGVQRSSISHILSGRNKPSFDFITKVGDTFPLINIEWFINGKGNMLKDTSRGQAVNLSLFPEDNKPVNEKDEDEFNLQIKNDTINNKEFTNVNNGINKGNTSVSKIILFYNDHTWQEFLPSVE